MIPVHNLTKIGNIPMDWNIKRLQEIISTVIDNRGKTPPYQNNSDFELIETASISFVNQYPDYSKVTKFVTEKIYNSWFRGHPAKMDILISTVGEYSGLSAIMKGNRGTIAQNIIALRVVFGIDPFYVFYWTRSESFNIQLKQVMMNQAQPSLRVPWLLDFIIALPSKKAEQQAISEALSDVDALIATQEALIAKKRAIKQGVMQELLTGKRRLPGFTGKWEEKEIGGLNLDISDGNYSSKYPKQSDFKDIGVPFIRANNLQGMKVIDDDMRFISIEQHNDLLKGHLKKDDILITTRGELGKIALVPDKYIDSNINAQIVRINTRSIINHIYFAFFLSYEDTQKKIKGEETGSALKQLPVGKLVKIPIVFPPIDEQQAIAKILSELEAEINLLVQKQEKTKALKQGMMQELLTGRIRLTGE